MRYIIENGKVWSPVLDCWAEVSLPMRRLINALNEHGYVDPIRDGGRSGTFVALMQRGILREAKGRAGRHYPATTPEQVWDEAYAEYDTREAADVEAEGGWGQPDGMLRTVEQERECGCLRNPLGHTVSQHLTEPVTQYSAQLGHYVQQDAAGFWHKASIADEVAALRQEIGRLWVGADGVSQETMLARLDRIAALVPQRATDADGWGIWLHACGHSQSARRGYGICDGCGARTKGTDGWRALYTVAGR